MLVAALAAATIALGLSGCGSGGSGSGPIPTPTPTPTPNAVPAVSTIAPNTAGAGESALTVVVSGSNFIAGSTLQFNGSSRATVVVNSGKLQAQITAADLNAVGKASLTVFNPPPGGGISNSVTFSVVPATIMFSSSRALDGTNAGGAPRNIWSMNLDGSNQLAVTKLTTLTNVFSQLPNLSRDATKILFQSSRALDGSDAANANGTSNSWVMNFDGSAPVPLTKITAPNASAVLPHWSPDGSKIVFFANRALDGSDAANANNVSNVWIVNSDGTAQAALTKLTAAGAFTNSPVFSPDGSKILFQSNAALDGTNAVNTAENIWVMNADGTAAHPLTRITTAGADSLFGSWSPDGSKVVFESHRALDGTDAINTNKTNNIWVINADGTGTLPLTRLTAGNGVNNADSFAPSWSPDGTRIVFVSRRALGGTDSVNTNDTANAWVMNADGSGAVPLTRLTAVGTDVINPVWSPGGTRIQFTSGRALDGTDAANTNGIFNIWSMNADGSSQVALTKLTAVGTNCEDPNQASRDSEIIN